MQNFINVAGQRIDLTAEQMEKIVADLGIQIQRKILAECEAGETVKLDEWWWLATPWNTPRHDNDRWILCVAPSGDINNVSYLNDDYGVRPF